MSVKKTCFPSSSLAMILLACSVLMRLASLGPRPRGKMASSMILASGKSLRVQHVRADSLGDFRAAAASRVVGADHEHNGLRLVALSFAVLKTPEHALGGIARNAEVGHFHVAEILLEDIVAPLAPRTFHRSVMESPRNMMSKSPLLAN